MATAMEIVAEEALDDTLEITQEIAGTNDFAKEDAAAVIVDDNSKSQKIISNKITTRHGALWPPPKLVRCTSTPVNFSSELVIGGLGDSKIVFLKKAASNAAAAFASPNFSQTSDSGIETTASDLSGSSLNDRSFIGSNEKIVGDPFDNISQIKPKKSQQINNASTTSSSSIITRSRSRIWSGSESSGISSFDATPSTSKSREPIRTIDLFKLPKSGVRNKPLETSSSKRFVYKHGLFSGLERMDIIKKLTDMQINHILSTIWSWCSVTDIANALQVSTVWHASVLMDTDAMERYSAAKEVCLENSLTRSRWITRLAKTSPRKALQPVSNILLSPVKHSPNKSSNHPHNAHELRRSPRLAVNDTGIGDDHDGVGDKRKKIKRNEIITVSPSKVRHRLFAEEAQKLKPGEKLQPCPRCTGPSRVTTSESRARCSRIGCKFDFCILCMCKAHTNPGSPCRSAKRPPRTLASNRQTASPSSSSSESGSPLKLTDKSTSTKARVMSKQSKRRLRRL